jgi:hypothetical protein
VHISDCEHSNLDRFHPPCRTSSKSVCHNLDSHFRGQCGGNRDRAKLIVPFVHFVSHYEIRDKNSWLKNEIVTYIHALKECQQYNSRWCLIVEDDSIAAKDLFLELKKLLLNVERQQQQQKQPVGSIKLFQTEYYFGWEKKDCLNLYVFSWIPFLVFCLIRWCISPLNLTNHYQFIANFFKKKKNGNCTQELCRLTATSIGTARFTMNTSTYKNKDIASSKALLFLHGILSNSFTIFVLVAFGKQNIIAPYRKNGTHLFHTANTIDSNTVATVYNTENNQNLINYLNHHQQHDEHKLLPLDMLINQWSIKNRFNRYYHVPSLFQHIGLWSSNRNKNKNNYGGRNGKYFKQSSTFHLHRTRTGLIPGR